MGRASRVWLSESLKRLNESLDGHLVVRRGEVAKVLEAVKQESGADRVYYNQVVGEPVSVEGEEFRGNLLYKPGSLGRPYQVFTPFWNALSKLPEPCEPLQRPRGGKWVKLRSDRFEICPEGGWVAPLASHVQAGEEAAKKRLKRFVDRKSEEYHKARDLMGEEGTSHLSPHLHFGEISVRQVWHALPKKGNETFKKELGWREFAHQILLDFPQFPDEPMREAFRRFPWSKSQKHLRAWQRGETGYPIVDAAMRELRQTGWMHNRARMIVASFLVKHLLVAWQEGAKWFWDELFDADLANNSLGWQWSAGCGPDAAPYFRIFNPVLQGKKFDPDGVYVRRYCPELAGLANSAIYAPWEEEEGLLGASGVRLGHDYPRPIVDHKEARARALAAFRKISSR
jgi:deoxyribodipyrimidine photo-lyase